MKTIYISNSGACATAIASAHAVSPEQAVNGEVWALAHNLLILRAKSCLLKRRQRQAQIIILTIFPGLKTGATQDYVLTQSVKHRSKSSTLKEHSKKALTPNGIYISIDHGTPLTPKEAFINLKSLTEQEKIKPVIDRVYPLEKMAEAHRYVEMGHKRGNVVITM